MADSEMLRRLDAILAEPAGVHVGVLGLGISGRAMARHLLRRGAQVVGIDQNTALQQDVELTSLGLELCLGEARCDLAGRFDLICISPGADPRQHVVREAVTAGVPVCGELALCGALPATVVAITGTNGKSTTTALIGVMAQALGKATFVGGNLGDPVITWLDAGDPKDVAVVELSSYQLETAYRFRADVAVVLNITPDHAERYADMEEYALAKERLLACVPETGTAILNADDNRVAAMAGATAGRVLWLSTRGATLPGDGVVYDEASDRLLPQGTLAPLGPFDLRHPRLFGRHNRENAAAAFLAAVALSGVAPTENSLSALRVAYQSFAGLPHRLELVAEVGDVQYINDSKATNDDSAAIAVRAMKRPTVLLVGGRDKGAGYPKLVDAVREGCVRLVLAFGEARPLVLEAFDGVSDVQVRGCASMREAFDAATAHAVAGDAVLLAPACSSFDEFDNYAVRGRTFAVWSRGLSERHR